MPPSPSSCKISYRPPSRSPISNTAALAWAFEPERRLDGGADGFRYGTPGAIVASASTIVASGSNRVLHRRWWRRDRVERHGIHDRGLVVRRSGDIAAGTLTGKRSPDAAWRWLFVDRFLVRRCAGSSMLQFTDGPPRGTKSDPIECTRESACGDFAVHAVYTISDWNYPCSPVSSQSILNQRFRR